MNARNLWMCLLSFFLLFSMNRVALAVDPYSFDSMWTSASWSVTGPAGVAKDSLGNLYVASGTDHRILKISSTGKILAQWGSYGTGNGQFNKPRNVAVDSGGNVYVADSLNNRIQKFDANGTYLTQWTASDSPFPLFNPAGLAIDSADNVYVTEAGGSSHSNNNRVLKFTSDGVYSATLGTGIRGIGDGQFKSPSGVAVHTINVNTINVYVADTGNNRIQKFVNGVYDRQWTSTGSGGTIGTLTSPSAVAVDSLGNVYVTDITDFFSPSYYLQKFDSLGTWVARSLISVGLNNPSALAVDSSRNLYVADTNNNRIAKFNSSFLYLSLADITGNTITPIGPSSVAVDGTRKYFYSTDITNNSILKYGLDGTFQTTWGSAGTTDGKFNFSNGSGVAVDTSGNVYVADTDNDRIQKFDANGNFLTKWVNDGAPSPTNLSGPGGVAVDASGYVYIADTTNSRIVKRIATTGAYVTQWYTSDTNNNVDYLLPSGVAVDTAGNNVYVVYRNANLIQQFTSNGNYVRQWGGAGTGEGQFNAPQSGVAVDSAGNVFVADTVNNRIQKFAADGTFRAAWGTQGTAAGQFFFPYGVAADVTGNIYVADTFNSRIQKFFPSPQIVMTVSGSGSGTVDSSPPGLSCSSTSSQPCTSSFFSPGSVVTLTASPTNGASTFQSWGGDCSACSGPTCLATMNSSKTCSAIFNTVVYPLNVTILGNGSVHSTNISPPGQTPFSCNTGTCSPVDYLSGTVVTLSATPSTDYVFSGWSTCQGKGTCDITMLDVRAVTATFSYVKPARVENSGGVFVGDYDTLTEAYTNVPLAGGTIKARDYIFTQPGLALDQSKTVAIRGGYDLNFSSPPAGYSDITGPLTIGKGSVTVERLIVK